MEVEAALAIPGLDKRRLHLDALLAVLQCEAPLHQLLIARSAVAVRHVVCGVAPHCLRVRLDGLRELARLEELVAPLALLEAELLRDVLAVLPLLERLLRGLEPLVHILGAVFELRVLVRLDRGLEVAELHVRVAHASVRLCDILVVGAVRAADLDRLLARVHRELVLALLEVHSREVGHVCHLIWHHLARLGVVLDRLVELLGLVGGVALLLLSIRLALLLASGLLLLGEVFLHWLGFWLGLLGRRRRTRLRLAAHEVTGTARLHVDSHQHAEHLHDARVLQVAIDR
mmetsp:Transcript_17430/g.45060  ORF Transcript_17430/g.45060 Transcript_17430/m.45060 type:complete len:288 (-) Transcript_17430:546-1409(-)